MGPMFPQDPIPSWLFLEILDMDSLTGRDNIGQARWAVEVRAASPFVVGAKELRSAASSCDIHSWAGDKPTGEQWADCLDSYGTHATIHSASGASLRPLVREAIREARQAIRDMNSYLGRSQNAIGTSGMEAMSGNLLAPLMDARTEGPEGQILRKMYQNSGPFLLGGDPNPLYNGGKVDA